MGSVLCRVSSILLTSGLQGQTSTILVDDSPLVTRATCNLEGVSKSLMGFVDLYVDQHSQKLAIRPMIFGLPDGGKRGCCVERNQELFIFEAISFL